MKVKVNFTMRMTKEVDIPESWLAYYEDEEEPYINVDPWDVDNYVADALGLNTYDISVTEIASDDYDTYLYEY